MRLSASVSGLADVQKYIAELEKTAKNRTVADAIDEACRTAHAMTLANIAATNKGTGDGGMASTLKIGKLKTKRTRKWRLVLTGTREELGIPSGSIGYYPASQEFGYLTRGSNRAAETFKGLWEMGKRKLASESRSFDTTRHKIAGRHFMRDAIQRMQALFPQIMKDHVSEMIRRGNVVAKRDKAYRQNIEQRVMMRASA